MKPTVDQKLNEVLGLEAVSTLDIIPQHEPAEIVTTSGNPEKDMLDDIAVVRTTMHSLIEKTNDLVDNANFFAKEKQDARSVEAAAMATKEARENAMALLNMHKVRKEIERTTSAQNGGDTNITQNAVFIGTTGDLLKNLKEMNAGGALTSALKTIDVSPKKDELNTGEKRTNHA